MVPTLSSGKYDPGYSFRIPVPSFYPSRIPDPGVKKAPDPGSGSATLLETICWTNCMGTYIPAGLDHAERGGQGEERLLNVDGAPPGERARAEGHAGEGQSREQEGGVTAQARQVLLNTRKNK